MTQFYEHMQTCLTEIGYYDPDKPRLLMRRLKRLFNRARLDINEYNILRCISNRRIRSGRILCWRSRER